MTKLKAISCCSSRKNIISLILSVLCGALAYMAIPDKLHSDSISNSNSSNSSSSSSSNKYYTAMMNSLLAGLATTFGGIIVVMISNHPSNKSMAFYLGLSSGVMMLVSVVDLIVPSMANAPLATLLFTISGVCFTDWLLWFLDIYFNEEHLLLPKHSHSYTDDEVKKLTKGSSSSSNNNSSSSSLSYMSEKARQLRLGTMLAVTLTLHNLPEGFAVAVSTAQSDQLGKTMAITIAMHNIPEGISIAVPIYASTGNALYAIGLSLLSGLSEPVGALCALPFINTLDIAILEITNSFVAGIMIAVVMKELMPEALKYNEMTHLITGFIIGCVFILPTII